MKISYAKIFTIAGGFIIAGLGQILYLTYSNRSLDKLSTWLENYIDDFKKKLKENLKNPFTIDNIAGIVNLITEIEDYLYSRDNPNLEGIRMSYLNDSIRYEQAINQELELHEKAFTKAIQIVERRLEINFIDLQEKFINYKNNKEFTMALEKNQKNFETLPQIEKDLFRKAYLSYTENAIKKEMFSKSLLTFPNLKHDHKDIVLDVYILNKYLLKDNLEKEYGFKEKYIYQLLRKHELLNDPEIISRREVLYLYNS